MNLDRFTQKAQEAVAQAQQLAQEFGHQLIEPAHLLLALLQQEDGIVPAVVTRAAGGVKGLRDEVMGDLQGRPKIYGSNAQVGLSRPSSDTLNAAERYSRGMQDEYVSTEHILLALTDSAEARRLEKYGLSKDAILKALVSVRGSQRVTSQNPEGTYQALERYGRDMTADAVRASLTRSLGAMKRSGALSDPIAAYEEQPGPDRRPGGRENGNCGRPGAAYGQRRCAGGIKE
jgi:ATP-dependent Clp protease ATP-binding subunit ClpB